MRLYTVAKWAILVMVGAFGIYHNAQGAAIGCFVLASAQPLVDKWSR